jgi:DNA polymerase-1
MTTIAVDCETHLIRPGCITPKLVCVTAYNGVGDTQLYDYEDGLALVRKLLEGDDHLTGQHFFYDLGVFCAEDSSLLRLVFKKLDDGTIHCTKIRDMMILNAKGELKFVENELGEMKPAKFSLSDLVWRRLGLQLTGKKAKKGEQDPWRLRYNELDGVPLDEWPDDARTYAMDDAGYTWMVHQDQEREVEPEGIPGEVGQTQAAWALHLMSAWGVRTDPEAVEKFEKQVLADYAEQEKLCMEYGFVRADGSKNMKAIKEAIVDWFQANGKKIPMTGKGNVKTDRKTLKMVEGGELVAVAELGRIGKLKTTYLPILKAGTQYPINAGYNAIIETFRTSCREPNMQNPPRKGGFRACFVPRVGWVYVFCDYGTLEMRTLAQVCLDLFGFSAMADALREGKDLHLMVGADMLDISYEEALARLKAGDDEVNANRQLAKPANFGFGGGMGPVAFVEYAEGYGIKVPLAKAKHLHKTFRKMWPEMKNYFGYCSGLVDRERKHARFVEFVRSGLVRGEVKYTAICNGFFQHLAAMGAKAALYAVTKECYLGEKPDGTPSPLGGCRPVFFLHDEIGMEVPYTGERASVAAERLSRVMIDVMQEWVPDLPILAEAVMMRRWYKGAEPVREGGVLIPCKPVKQDGKTVWVKDGG